MVKNLTKFARVLLKIVVKLSKFHRRASFCKWTQSYQGFGMWSAHSHASTFFTKFCLLRNPLHHRPSQAGIIIHIDCEKLIKFWRESKEFGTRRRSVGKYYLSSITSFEVLLRNYAGLWIIKRKLFAKIVGNRLNSLHKNRSKSWESLGERDSRANISAIESYWMH